MAVAEKTLSNPSSSKKVSSSQNLDQLRPQIEKRAKEIFLKRQASKTPGNEISDWLAAEKEVKSKYQSS